MDPFNVRNMKKAVVDSEDGVATIDWIVLLAALTGLGIAIVDMTSSPLGDHTQNVRGELQDNVFETSWTEHIPVGPSGAGMPDGVPEQLSRCPVKDRAHLRTEVFLAAIRGKTNFNILASFDVGD